jgi:hypothetical protein
MEVFIFICMFLGGYLIGYLIVYSIRKALFGSKPSGEAKYIDVPKDESDDEKIDRLISILEGVCDELEDMR